MLKISLRKIKFTDKKYFAKWWNDKALLKLTSGILEPISEQEIEKYFSLMLKNKEDYHFIITLDHQVIGHISLSKRKDRWYETQIVIGEKEHWNKGYGPEAIALLVNKAKPLGISKIYLEVRPDNLRAIKAYQKCGFVKRRIKKYPKNKYLPKTLKMEFKLR